MKRFRRVTGVTSEQTVATLGGLRLTYECAPLNAGVVTKIRIRSEVNDARVTVAIIRGPAGSSVGYYRHDPDLDQGEAFEPDVPDMTSAAWRLTYMNPQEGPVHASLGFSIRPASYQCTAQGVVTGG
jgi:hypothetical protein